MEMGPTVAPSSLTAPGWCINPQGSPQVATGTRGQVQRSDPAKALLGQQGLSTMHYFPGHGPWKSDPWPGLADWKNPTRAWQQGQGTVRLNILWRFWEPHHTCYVRSGWPQSHSCVSGWLPSSAGSGVLATCERTSTPPRLLQGFACSLTWTCPLEGRMQTATWGASHPLTQQGPAGGAPRTPCLLPSLAPVPDDGLKHSQGALAQHKWRRRSESSGGSSPAWLGWLSSCGETASATEQSTVLQWLTDGLLPATCIPQR